jgi:hypothetical protein
MLWGRILKAIAFKFSTRSTCICRAKGKGGVVSGGNGHSGDITEGKEVSEWIWIGSSVSEVTDYLEYVFLGTRT